MTAAAVVAAPETAPQIQTDKKVQALTILKRSVCLQLLCSNLGNTRSVRLDDIELRQKKHGDDDGSGETHEVIGTDKKALAMQKKLLDSSVLSKPVAVQEQVKSYLRSVATAGHKVFGPGIYLVPSVMVPEVDARLGMYMRDFDAAKAEFVKKYEAAVEDRKAKLKELFNPADYPPAEQAAAAFQIDWNYRSFGAPDNLEHVDKAIARAAEAKYMTQMGQMYDEVERGLMQAALHVVRELQERLAPKADGTRKALYDTALDDLREFLRTLPFRNMTDNEQLQQALAKVTEAAAGIEVEDIRGSKHLRAKLAEAAAEAAAKLGDLVQETGSRGISLAGGFGA
jgi:hypothetical protein